MTLRIVGTANTHEPVLLRPPARVIELCLPYPPSGGTRLAMRGHRMFRTSAYKAWLAEVAMILATQRVRPFMDGKLALEAVFYPETRRLGDIDNLVKTLGDSLQGPTGAYLNDSMIDYIVAQRIWGTGRGEVEVRISRLA